MSPIKTDYKWIKNFRDFVDEYAEEKGITVEEALEEEQVKVTWRYYTEL